jgi:hypothetical protein
MALPKPSEIEILLRGWLTSNQKEDARLEFKLCVVLSIVGAKAEFIRDVLSLANSEGESNRGCGYLVIGFRDGEYYDVRSQSYDGAKFSQIVEANISPDIDLSYQEFDNGEGGRIGVLTLAPDPNTLYVVRKELRDNQGKAELLPGQSWGRKDAGCKIILEGNMMQARLNEIVNRRIEETEERFQEKIDKLEREGGPAFEVKRIRFDIEATSDPADVERHLARLLPYAREFGLAVKHEVLDAVSEVTGRAQQGMSINLAASVDAVLSALMPVGWGGMHYPSREEISRDDQKLMERIGHLTFEMTWAACRYFRDLAVVKVCARRYWELLRFTGLNGLQWLYASFLENARQCQEKCNELRTGNAFPEGWTAMEYEIKDALDQNEEDARETACKAALKREHAADSPD